MFIPTVDQTAGVWIERTANQGYHTIQAVFPEETGVERAHRANCRFLIQRGSLQPEHGEPPLSPQEEREEVKRYRRVHVQKARAGSAS